MRRDDILLLDMLLAAREAVEFADGLTFETFDRNRMAQLAILKAVEIVGEAASRIGTETRDAHPEIPWGDTVEAAIQRMQARKQGLADALFEGTGRGPLGLAGEDIDALFGPARTGSPAGP